MSFEEQSKEMRDKAVAASKRVSIDTVIGLHHTLRNVVIPPGSHVREEKMAPVRSAEYVLANVPDLLTLATYAWYQLQEGE